MDAGSVATLLSAVGLSGVVAALINFYANKKKVGADATKIITEAATSVVSTLREEVKSRDARIDALEQRELERDRRERARDNWERKQSQMLNEHAEWDRLVVHELNQLIPPLELPEPPPLLPPESRHTS